MTSHIIGTHQCGSNVLQLKGCEAVQLFVDALEYMVVEVPGLVQLSLLAGHFELLDPFVRLRQLTTIRLIDTECVCVCVLGGEEVCVWSTSNSRGRGTAVC